ncbi:hypothetical protein AX768_10245 [Burkholderia sp. PAMC 28687]|uniref:hypothetical protein n=2 Tax=Burkholderiaceae TaxID=119060 RepID=UPI0007864A45|nr:hypothetical protein [Burkholderia sp. PAMC 28687]AMM14423.1 hypothetical protein AX768_10245 [Burkholderia sp. PAMC 28687]
MWSTSAPRTANTDSCNTEFLRRHARRLLRLARGESTSTAMPVLRRLLAAGVMREATTLTQLHEKRAAIQLKHVLNMLAVELGHFGWDACQAVVDTQAPAVIDRYRFDAGAFGDYEKVWFASAAESREWQREHGGYIVEYGDQAVAILWRE